MCTLPETNIASEDGWLGGYFLFVMAYFQGRTVTFREGSQWLVQLSRILIGLALWFTWAIKKNLVV